MCLQLLSKVVPMNEKHRVISCRMIVVAAGLVCGVAWAGDKDGPPPAPGSVKGSSASELPTLKKEVDDAYAAFSRAYGHQPESEVEKCWQAYMRKAEDNALKALEMVRKGPKSPESFAALDWIASTPRNLQLPYGQQAVELLLEYHAENPNVGRLCSIIGYYGDILHEPTIAFLRAVSDKNPDRIARGQAFLGLARLIWVKARYFDYQKKGDPAPLYREAGQLLETVLDKYADCPDLRNAGIRRAGKTLGDSAQHDLFELRELAVGKTAPEIAGEDMDGRPLKLSDYRGKVVVLTFWASWCGPCMGMVPHERGLVERMKGKPFALVGVNGDDDRALAKKTAETNKMTWPSFWNGGTNGPITDFWNIQGWPMTYVLDPKGVIRFKQVREKKMDDAVDLLVKELEQERQSHGE
jgi:thiol-disulfide isomerase/thioredoxin